MTSVKSYGVLYEHRISWCLHLSAICQSMGVVEMTPLIITMSAQWFPKNERNMMATDKMFGVGGHVHNRSQWGMVNDGSLKPFIKRSQIMHNMLHACLVLDMFVTLLMYMFFPKRNTPLTYEPKL